MVLADDAEEEQPQVRRVVMTLTSASGGRDDSRGEKTASNQSLGLDCRMSSTWLLLSTPAASRTFLC